MPNFYILLKSSFGNLLAVGVALSLLGALESRKQCNWISAYRLPPHPPIHITDLSELPTVTNIRPSEFQTWFGIQFTSHGYLPYPADYYSDV